MPDIAAQRFNSNGIKIGEPFFINQVTEGIQFGGRTDRLENGDLVAVWQTSSDLQGGLIDVKARIFGPDGTPRGSEFLVHEVFAGVQRSPDVAALPGNRFVVTWTDESGLLNDPGVGVAARIFDGFGFAEGAAFQLNDSVPGVQEEAQLTVSGTRLLATWSSENRSGAIGTGADVAWRIFDVEAGKANIPVDPADDLGKFMERTVSDTVVFSDGSSLSAMIRMVPTDILNRELVLTIRETPTDEPEEIVLSQIESANGPISVGRNVEQAFSTSDGRAVFKISTGFSSFDILLIFDPETRSAVGLTSIPMKNILVTPDNTLLGFDFVGANFLRDGIVFDRGAVSVSEFDLDGQQIGESVLSSRGGFNGLAIGVTPFEGGLLSDAYIELSNYFPTFFHSGQVPVRCIVDRYTWIRRHKWRLAQPRDSRPRGKRCYKRINSA